MRAKEFITEDENLYVIQIHGIGEYEDPDHDGYFSGDRRGNVIVPRKKAMRYTSEREALAAGQQAIDILHTILSDEDTTHDKRFENGHAIVVDDNGSEAFDVRIRRIVNETTSAGGIATVVGGGPMLYRNPSIYGEQPKKKKKSKKANKYANSKQD
jgi:hypothetical protein